MQKISRLFLLMTMLLLVVMSGAQNSITLTFTAMHNTVFQPLDSILTENLTQGTDTMLYSPDTVLVLDHVISVFELQEAEAGGLVLYPAFPNPFNGSTSIQFFIPQSDHVLIMVYDLLGRQVAAHDQVVQAGKHTYHFTAAHAGQYIVVVMTNRFKKSQKLISLGKSTGSPSLGYIGPEWMQYSPRTALLTSGWAHGDELRFTGFATLQGGMKAGAILNDTPTISKNYTFQFAGIPSQPSLILGDTIPCENTPGLIYQVTPEAGITYTWVVPAGWTITAGQGSHQIEVTSGSASGVIEVIPSDAHGIGPARTLVINTLHVPATPPSISGNRYPCAGSMEEYSTVSLSGVGYVWSVPSGWSIESGVGTHTIEVMVGDTLGPVELSLTNQCGASTPHTFDIFSTYLGCFPPGYVHCDSTQPTVINEVYNPFTNRIWMDRNLGAWQEATSTSDTAAFGDLFQWGRFADGHQCRNSATTNIQSPTNQPGHPDFIISGSNNWLTQHDHNLWQGSGGINNPCPGGFRVPTHAEWSLELPSWGSQGSWAQRSVKLTNAGQRTHNHGTILEAGTYGYYWTQTVSGNFSIGLSGIGLNYTFPGFYRHRGFTVRCIKDFNTPPYQPSAIIGDTFPCENDSGYFYSVNPQPGVSYIWTLPGGWIITSGHGTHEIVVQTGTGSGTIEVTPSYGSAAGPSQTLDVATNRVPMQPSAITGETIPCLGHAAIYHINPTYGVDYNWQTPPGWIINTGQGMHEITVTPASSTGIMQVTPSNLCGQGIPQSLPVTFTTISCFPTGFIHCDPSHPTPIQDITNPVTGKTWMNQNLGARQVAVSSSDTAAYGDLYQWGRFADGHQCRNSATTQTTSLADRPFHGSFILTADNWRNPPNHNLWQSVLGANNPCPGGYRLPSEAEFQAEVSAWSSPNTSGAFGSPLKLTATGFRDNNTGVIGLSGTHGYYWTGSIVGNQSSNLFFAPGSSSTPVNGRALGYAVRCIKHGSAPPAQPSPINGPNNPCFNQAGLVYSVTQEPGVFYLWSVPAGWSITAGQGTHAITVAAGSGNGLIEVTPSNAYGNGTQQMLSVTPMLKPQTPVADVHLPGTHSIEWKWFPATGATEYRWGTVNNPIISNNIGPIPSYTELGLVCAPCGVNYTRYLWGSNVCTVSEVLIINASTSSCSTVVVDVTSHATGKVWMDRNLGASQVATSSTDSMAIGDLYQWGRPSDGHQCRNSDTTSTRSTTYQPGHGNFIVTESIVPFNWLTVPNDSLWQGVNGVNNPCATGYRLPTQAELNAERLSWSNNHSSGAFASPLKLTNTGLRHHSHGSVESVNTAGRYWSSSVSANNPSRLYFQSSIHSPGVGHTYPAWGYAVRCIKD